MYFWSIIHSKHSQFLLLSRENTFLSYVEKIGNEVQDIQSAHDAVN